ncbi:hypothetical protein BDV18DRAFT_6185 [Aspergillus unguis]
MSSSLRRITPRFLSPAWARPRTYQPQRFFRSQHALNQFSRLEEFASESNPTTSKSNSQEQNQPAIVFDAPKADSAKIKLPTCCPGCGAYAQTVEPNEPGYYGKTRKQTRKASSEAQNNAPDEPLTQEAVDSIKDLIARGMVSEKSQRAKLEKAAKARLEEATKTASEYLNKSKSPVPVCDRCHDLMHHNKAVPAVSPTISSIEAYLDESPYKQNRIYHVIDAADFPMSLVDGIYEELSIQGQRSRNRRSATTKYKHGRKLPTISFVITRSDLLGPTKEFVDSKMEYVRSILREKLNLPGDEFRMGNVHMVSAHRGWWTKNVKEEMREHAGGLWIVGKANAGKSSFVEACLPKDSRNLEKMAELIAQRNEESAAPTPEEESDLDSDGLLPPAPKEDLYPVLPVVSSLPGTTVSPIRIPFGRGKGEIIDLPGLDRGNLADHVVDEHKRDLIMAKRGKPERHTVKPAQSLLLGGGLVRITPLNPETIIMAACFVPIEAHVTSTEKATEMQAQERKYPGTNIMKAGTGKVISSAGTFDLKWDVTRSHLPRALEKSVEDKGIKPPPLPYKVMSADILVEGCGWVELTAQVRAKAIQNESDADKVFPRVEVFSPQGKHIAIRKPLESYQTEVERRAAQNRKNGPRRRQNAGHIRRVKGSQKKKD